MGIFKAYDVRGVYPDELDEKTAEAIGRAFAKYIGKSPIAAGRDIRLSSPALEAALVRGMTAAGADVLDLGMISTPMLYFGVGKHAAEGGVTVTASHNPGKYNGFKMCKAQSYPMSETAGLPEVKALMEKGVPDAKRKGSAKAADVREGYEKHVAAFAKTGRRLKVVVDASNGASGTTLPGVFRLLDADLVPLFFEPDGRFPNHEPNPLKEENLKALQAAVKREKAAFGACMDGDADRCVFVDEKGAAIPGDIMTGLIAAQFLKEQAGAAVVYDLRSSHAVPEEIARLGGKAVRERVGHSFIKTTMRQHEAAFAGELSGHYYFRDHWYADCGEIALMKVLSLVSNSDKPLSALVKPLRKYALSGEINFHVEDKDGKIKELAETFKDAKIDYLDGITAEFGDWWFNVRKSNTEPMLRLNLEGKTKKAKEEGMKRVLALLGKPEA
ncbi:MAG: phosphomannomutase/phosphoglucomutase [Planctomycetes bacterium]|jgi:phosphomannomutase|nr:phosphomannomutase/phosphoglucomutase [Planctomycetota bacterium]